MIKYIFVISLLLLTSFNSPLISNREIVDNMFSALENIQTLRFKLKKLERIEGEMKSGEQDVKYNRSPLKVYTYVISPNKGVEVLFLEGKNNGHAYINPNAFPYINLNLDPYGSVMRKGNHHTVYEVGFDYVYKIMKDINQESGSEFNKYFQYTGDVKFNNRDCYKVEIDYLPYKIISYKVLPNENVTDIAYKLHLSDYMILELNKDLDDYDDVEPGQQIMVMNAYAKKTILYIDKQNFLPVFQAMHDDKGLFEQYEFYNVIVNSKIEEDEFTRDYKGYGF